MPSGVSEARSVILLVLDGLGWKQLRSRADLLPTFTALEGGPITTVAPTTTAAALTSITTGLPPGEHGVVGHRVALEDTVLNTLRWSTSGGDGDNRPDPRSFQPHPVFGSQRPPVITRAEHDGSGFTQAHLANTRFFGYKDRSGAVEAILETIDSSEAFVYAYWDGIDRVAHEFGLDERYEAELVDCDAMVDEILNRLPPDTGLVVTADHGQVHVGTQMLDLPAEVAELVVRQSGEARFRWLHGLSGASEELLVASREAFADVAWVVGVDEVIDFGWLGPVVTPIARARLGDIALISREPVGFVDPAELVPIQLISRHGSLTPDEVFVPLLGAVT